MRKLLLKDYPITVTGPEGEEIVKPYNMRASLTNVLLSPHLQLDAAKLLLNHKLASKIGDELGDEVLLEDEEYGRLKNAIETFKGYLSTDVELVTRVLEAPTVEVVEEVEVPADEPATEPEAADASAEPAEA